MLLCATAPALQNIRAATGSYPAPASPTRPRSKSASGHYAGSDCSHIIAIMRFRASQRRQFKRLTRCHHIGTQPQPLQQHRLTHFCCHVCAVIRARAIDVQTDGDTGMAHMAYRGDTRARLHTGAGTMRDTRPAIGEQLNALGIQLYVVRMPDVRIYPNEDLQVLCRHHIECLTAITDIVIIFRQMSMHWATVLTSQRCRLLHQLMADRTWRTWRHHHT